MPPQQQTAGQGIQDTYLLGTAYTQEKPQDLVNADLVSARAAAYAPEPFKDEIQKAAQYWYKNITADMDGFDQVQAQAKASLNPPSASLLPPPPSAVSAATGAQRRHLHAGPENHGADGQRIRPCQRNARRTHPRSGTP